MVPDSQAYAILVAVLVSAEATTKEEAAGLLAHMQVVIQLCIDLGSLKWLQYDEQYWEWAAASGKRVWGEVNLSIYWQCLYTPTPSISEREMRFNKPQTQSNNKSCKSKRKNKVCFKPNFEISCGRTEHECFIDHVCWYCSAPNHIAGDCPQAPKRVK